MVINLKCSPLIFFLTSLLMWQVFRFIQLVLIVVLTIVSGILGILLMLILRSPKVAMHLVPNYLWSPGLFWVLGVRLKVVSPITSPAPAIYAANHASPLDIPAMFLALPVNGYFIAKIELKKIPIMGWFMSLAGMIFIDRSKRDKAMESMNQAGEEMKKGKSVIVFPEGTRSKTGEIQLFKRGAFILSKESGVPITPVLIKGAHAVLPPGKFLPHPGIIEVKFFENMLWNDSQYKVPEDFANHCQHIISQEA